jgi:ABC-2 type transport system permease protein
MSWRVIRAVVLKYATIWIKNIFRISDIFFYPVVDLFIWGLLTLYMLKVSYSAPGLINFLIAAIVLFNILLRSQQVITISFLDDIWNRNLINLFAAPIRLSEYITALCLLGTIQCLVVFLLLAFCSYFFYAFNFLVLGIYCFLFFINLLIMGWSMGFFTSAIILRWGQSAESLAWMMPFFVQPLSAVFYPVSTLPAWLQPVALCLPSTHVFEGVREIINTGSMQSWHLICAFLLNIIYLTASFVIFYYLLQEARKHGSIAKYIT